MATLTAEQIALEIQAELSRLNADTNSNAYSGLLVEVDKGKVSIYDDYARAVLTDPEATLSQLKTLEPIDWESHDNTETAFEPIWDSVTLTGGY